ncbi:MAG: dihydroorotate dehydrogenase electron transfer subunit [Clostridia bacterium]|nr:dihydroorotate dehydrogenase electron transfer subunit [Clostridia bacterium]
MIFTKGKIVEQKAVANGYYLLSIAQPDIASKAIPGQFVMLKAWERGDLILPRPFSLYRILPRQGQLQILYKVRGKGTAEMARRVPGDEVELIGPSGNGVTLPAKGAIALLGRGIGAAPLMAIAEEAAAKGLAVYTFLSARKRELVLGDEDFARYSRRVIVATDADQENGSRLLTDLLADLLSEGISVDRVFTCGSKRLARGLVPMQSQYGFKAYVLLEEVMACGIGACKGCVCKIAAPGGGGVVYKKVCQDGPVFPVDEVVW